MARRTVGFCASASAAAVLALALISPAAASPTSFPFSYDAVDMSACRFPVHVHEAGTGTQVTTPVKSMTWLDPAGATMTLTNVTTGRSVNVRSESVTQYGAAAWTFVGSQLWWGNGSVPFETTSGSMTVTFADGVASSFTNRQPIDVCGLLDPTRGALTPSTSPGPWPAPADPLGQMAVAGTAVDVWALREHTHAHLDVIVNGHPVTVPGSVGIAEPEPVGTSPTYGTYVEGYIGPVHTHTASGVIHVESDEVRTYTLGQFFDLWGVRLTGSCLGGYCTTASSSLRVYVNGTQITGDPRAVALNTPGQFAEGGPEIAVVFGPAGVPAVVPASFDFSCMVYVPGQTTFGC